MGGSQANGIVVGNTVNAERHWRPLIQSITLVSQRSREYCERRKALETQPILDGIEVGNCVGNTVNAERHWRLNRLEHRFPIRLESGMV